MEYRLTKPLLGGESFSRLFEFSFSVEHPQLNVKNEVFFVNLNLENLKIKKKLSLETRISDEFYGSRH